MKKYYLMAIEKNNHNAMNNLGKYYQFIEKNYSLMEKYYLMAIEKNNETAASNLANYYYVEKNYNQMEKYLFIAINDNHKNDNYIYAANLINNILNNKFQINFALKFYNWLSEKHLTTLNNKLNIYYQFNLIMNINMETIECTECIICYNHNYILKFNCGHHTCYKCYEKLDKCPFCRILK